VAYLEIQGLQKTYPDGTDAVKGISLSVEEGEFIVLLGPSGCGKTTTLRMLAGLEIPTGGQIVLNDRNLTNLPSSHRDVGFIFQFYALYPHMTVAQNISFPLENMGVSKEDIAKQVSEVADRVGITALMSQYPGPLSGGDQQRVALARAMVRRPMLYLMDEPLGTLDADHRMEMREFIREQQTDTGVTTIYVTHDQEEAMALADRMVVMKEGHICQVGTPSEVYEDPSDPFVAHFVGSPGMNLLDAKLVAEKGHLAIMANNIPIIAHLPTIEKLKPGSVTLGIRSEYLIPDAEGPIEGQIVLVEHLGAFAMVYINTSWGRLVMRAPSVVDYEPGAPIRITYDPQHMKVFT
jgi:multiple sugar transport system ATP-binding protein